MHRVGMSGHFTGWPEQAFDVLLRLEGEPSHSVREKCRAEREALVRKPMLALFADVAAANPAYDDYSVWSYGKGAWWWQHQSGVVRMERQVELGLRFDLDGLQAAGTGWLLRGEKLALFRAAVADDDHGPQLVEILDDLRRAGLVITGDQLVRAPRGYPADHPRADLLRYRTLTAVRELGSDDWLHTPEVVDRVLAAYEELRPLMSWLADQVATSPFEI